MYCFRHIQSYKLNFVAILVGRKTTHQYFQKYNVISVIHSDEREWYVWNHDWNLLEIYENWRFGLHGEIWANFINGL